MKVTNLSLYAPFAVTEKKQRHFSKYRCSDSGKTVRWQIPFIGGLAEGCQWQLQIRKEIGRGNQINGRRSKGEEGSLAVRRGERFDR